MYGEDGDSGFPPANELAEDPSEGNQREFCTTAEEREAGIFVVDDEEIEEAMSNLEEMSFDIDDGNFGIDLYCEAVGRLSALSESLL